MRRSRLLREGADYHVSARANRSEMLLAPEKYKNLMLAVIQRAKKKYRFKVKNFSIMNNHIHLLIKPSKNESLSRIMQWILSVFARRWNRENGVKGHFWGERFFSRIIEKLEDFLRTFDYIDNNPVKANLVDSPWDWKFGGCWHHRNGITSVSDPPGKAVLRYFPEHGIQ